MPKRQKFQGRKIVIVLLECEPLSNIRGDPAAIATIPARKGCPFS
jgi:hypothetical protein